MLDNNTIQEIGKKYLNRAVTVDDSEGTPKLDEADKKALITAIEEYLKTSPEDVAATADLGSVKSIAPMSKSATTHSPLGSAQTESKDPKPAKVEQSTDAASFSAKNDGKSLLNPSASPEKTDITMVSDHGVIVRDNISSAGLSQVQLAAVRDLKREESYVVDYSGLSTITDVPHIAEQIKQTNVRDPLNRNIEPSTIDSNTTTHFEANAGVLHTQMVVHVSGDQHSTADIEGGGKRVITGYTDGSGKALANDPKPEDFGKFAEGDPHGDLTIDGAAFVLENYNNAGNTLFTSPYRREDGLQIGFPDMLDVSFKNRNAFDDTRVFDTALESMYNSLFLKYEIQHAAGGNEVKAVRHAQLGKGITKAKFLALSEEFTVI